MDLCFGNCEDIFWIKRLWRIFYALKYSKYISWKTTLYIFIDVILHNDETHFYYCLLIFFPLSFAGYSQIWIQWRLSCQVRFDNATRYARHHLIQHVLTINCVASLSLISACLFFGRGLFFDCELGNLLKVCAL